jgi:hypothetical protein
VIEETLAMVTASVTEEQYAKLRAQAHLANLKASLARSVDLD